MLRFKVFILLSMAMLLALAVFPGHAVADTITVNTNDDADDGVCDATHCSLREAINDSNASAGVDTIGFDIGPVPEGEGVQQVHTIQPTSPLPTITDPVVIDGATQPGFEGTPVIELDGSLALSAGLVITGGSSTVRGLVINRFGDFGVVIGLGGGNVLEGNFIGTDSGGGEPLGNANGGVFVFNSPNNTIGGIDAEAAAVGPCENACNLISGNGDDGIVILGPGATGNVVSGNIIGADITGALELGNADDGIHILGASGNTIGGTEPGAGNLISGNEDDGIDIEGPGAAGNVAQGNLIGAGIDGVDDLGNAFNGVIIKDGASNNIVGGAAPGSSNTIAFNGANGVLVESGAGNAIDPNSIFSNVGLGIDLGNDGATPNDADDADSGINNLQNFPDIASAQIRVDGDLLVEYSVDSAPANSAYPLLVELFLADEDGEEGMTFVGSDSYPEGSAQEPIAINLGNAAELGVSPGDLIVATATDAGGNTSEFSRPATPVTEEPEPVTCGGLEATIVGTTGPDFIFGTTGSDVIAGLNGGDIIIGLEGNDIICGDGGADIIIGGPGNDLLFAGGGGDIISGGEGNDAIDCGAGFDILNAGMGVDVELGNCEIKLGVP